MLWILLFGWPKVIKKLIYHEENNKKIFESRCLHKHQRVYWVSQKKWKGRFSVHCELKVLYIFTLLDKASSAAGEWYLDFIKFGWVILINYDHFLKYGNFQISLDFCNRWVKNCGGTNLPYRVLWKPIDPWQQKKHGIIGFHRTTYGLFVPTKFFAHRSQKSSEIWKWLHFKKCT